MSIGVIQYLLRFYLIKLIRRADDGERSSFEKQNKFSASTFYSILQQSKRENMQIPVVLRYEQSEKNPHDDNANFASA